jgi:hypothetical protein
MNEAGNAASVMSMIQRAPATNPCHRGTPTKAGTPPAGLISYALSVAAWDATGTAQAAKLTLRLSSTGRVAAAKFAANPPLQWSSPKWRPAIGDGVSAGDTGTDFGGSLARGRARAASAAADLLVVVCSVMGRRGWLFRASGWL